jgi:LacI family transcriptional regulator
MATIYDVAREAGVSRSTVSRVINQRPYVKEEIRRKVLATMKELGYAPRQMAVRKMVAIAVPGETFRMGLYEAAVVSGLATQLIRVGLGVRVQPVKDITLERAFDVRCVIGLGYDDGFREELKKAGDAQAILLNNVGEGVHSVRSDHAQGVALAVEKLAALGHRRVGIIAAPCEGWGNLERIRGYGESVAKLGLEDDPALLRRQRGTLVESMAALLLAKPTAVIVCGEGSSIEANYALKVLGRKIPDDVSLVTYETEGVSKHMFPPNSTIDQDIEGICSAAAGLAMRIVEGETPAKPIEIVSSNRFVERESTKILK